MATTAVAVIEMMEAEFDRARADEQEFIAPADKETMHKGRTWEARSAIHGPTACHQLYQQMSQDWDCVGFHLQ
jgi:hypothetical protein